MSEPTPDQRLLLNAVWQAYRREGRWPSYRGIDQVLDRQGLRVRPLVESMPTGLLLPDVERMSQVWFPRDSDEFRVQIAGLAYCDDTDDDLALVARLVRYLADRERQHVMPSLSDPQPLRVSSEEAKHDLGLSDEEVVRSLSLLTTFESRVLNGGSHGADAWLYEIDVEEVRRYRNVGSVEEYLAARRAPDRPRLVPLPPIELNRPIVAFPDSEGEPAANPRQATLATPGRLRHPIVVTVASTVIGGLLLTGILAAIHLI